MSVVDSICRTVSLTVESKCRKEQLYPIRATLFFILASYSLSLRRLKFAPEPIV